MQCRSWLVLGAAALMVGLCGGCGTNNGMEDTYVADAAVAEVMTFPVRVLAMGIIEPVSLRLENREGDVTLLDVQRDGELSFAGELPEGDSFAVTFAASAGDCVLQGATGVVAQESPQVVLVCPLLDNLQVLTARADELAFTPTGLRYEMDVSLLAEAISVLATTSREGIEITVADMAVTSGQPSPAIPLALGDNEIAVVARHPASGASIRHVLTIRRAAAVAQYAYGKASNTDAYDEFGHSVALSASGDTLAVGAHRETSQATGIDGNQADNSAEGSGAVYVFARTGTTWSQQAYIKASNTDAYDEFGYSVALSATGDTLAVGAHGEDSRATGIGGNQADNSAEGSGAVYVFARTSASWSQQAYIKASNTGASDRFGSSVALSAGGDTLAVGALQEDSQTTGIDGNQADNSAEQSGAVYIFARTGTTWSQQAYVKASNTGTNDSFGQEIALSATGDTLAVSAPGESSQATGIGGNQADNSARGSGAVYVFARTGPTWSQQAYVKASNTGLDDFFGWSVALSATGDTLAVSARQEDSQATGIGGNQADNIAEQSGAVYVFARTGTAWSQQAYVKASNTDTNDYFGSSVALSASGNTLAVSAELEASQATGTGGNQDDNSAEGGGAVYVFARTGTAWSQEAYIKASNTGTNDYFGSSVALSGTGDTLAICAFGEDSQATGIGGNQADDNAEGSGAIYLFY